MSFVCQACGGSDLKPFYRVPRVPAHSCLMFDTRREALAFPRGELDIVFCRGCGFIQNRAFDASLTRYSAAYEETQAYSPRFLEFLRELCDDQIARFGLGPGRTALEIGCGKGEFLVMLCERSGCRGIGLDPSYRPERTRSEAASRIEFIRDFYGPRYAHLQADYICCRHTLEHIGPVREFMRLIRSTIGDRREVAVSFELPDTERVLEEGAFWDVYYEHCSYFTRGSLARLFRATGFELLDLYKVYDGQYLIIEARAAAGPTEAAFAAEDDLERIEALVERFADRVARYTEMLAREVCAHKQAGGRLAIWGSGSKGVSFISALGLGEELDAVVDINPHKHGKFLAGSGHEIVGPGALQQIRPELVYVMNPIYTEEIRRILEELGLRPRLVPLAGLDDARDLPAATAIPRAAATGCDAGTLRT